MMKTKKKVRYVRPRVIGASALLLDLICASVRFNVQVDPLTNINSQVDDNGNTVEPLYFEF